MKEEEAEGKEAWKKLKQQGLRRDNYYREAIRIAGRAQEAVIMLNEGESRGR